MEVGFHAFSARRSICAAVSRRYLIMRIAFLLSSAGARMLLETESHRVRARRFFQSTMPADISRSRAA
jgi:hypothetical protein